MTLGMRWLEIKKENREEIEDIKQDAKSPTEAVPASRDRGQRGEARQILEDRNVVAHTLAGGLVGCLVRTDRAKYWP